MEHFPYDSPEHDTSDIAEPEKEELDKSSSSKDDEDAPSETGQGEENV